jgi:transketolase
MLAARFNTADEVLIDHHTYVIASDGDLQEGVASEACSIAGHLGLGRLIVYYDDNHISIEGDTDLAFSEDVGKRFEAYGWHVQNLGEDIELDRLQEATDAAKSVEDRPSLVILRTHIAQGSPNKQDTGAAHGSPLGEDEVRLTKEVYGWPPDEQFLVPDEVLAHFRQCLDRGREHEDDWNGRLAAYRDANPELAAQLDLIMEGRLPNGWDAGVPRFDPGDGPVATRKASNQVIQWAAAAVPHLVGGSADLAPSTLTLIDGDGSVKKGDYSGRNLHFGIREHGMGAIVNGLTLHGLKSFGATFLIFSDYMRGSVRLAALMGLPSLFVYTHDSIGLGEDGPTHQPIEQLPGLRAVPNLYVVRPADANETALAWRFALEQTEHPVAFALSRQGLPIQDPGSVPEDAIHRGAYVLRESSKGSEPDLILIATGSEVHICAAAAELLEGEGIATRVVSAPCLDAFAEQEEGYRDMVLPPACRARVSVEAASPYGWSEWTTDDGDSLGMTTFGASGKQKDLYAHFGFTPENVAERGRAVVERLST